MQMAEELTNNLANLSLQAVAEEDLWENLGDDLEWDDGAGHGEEDAVVEDMDIDGLEEAQA
jgi:hypothetical protein